MDIFIRKLATRPNIFLRISRPISTSVTKNALPPILIVLIKPASRILAMIVGRRTRKWWQKLPEEQKDRFRAKRENHGKILGFSSVILTAFVAFGYQSHLEECQLTGRKKFIALKKNQVEKIAESESENLLEDYTTANCIIPTTDLRYDKVSKIVLQILKSNEDIPEVKEKNWKVTVIDQEDQNAFVLPNGHIFVFNGMLDMCSNDSQLGIVIGHEIAHALLNHTGEKLTYVNFISALLLIPMAVIWAFVPNDGIAMVTDWFINKVSDLIFELPFSRQMETEADEVGLKLAAKACIDIREAPLFWAKMKLESEKTSEAGEIPEFTSTHPTHEHREQMLASMVPDLLKLRTSCKCYKLPDLDPYLASRKSIEHDLKVIKWLKFREAHKSKVIVVKGDQ